MASHEELQESKNFELDVLSFLSKVTNLAFSKQSVDINDVSFSFDCVAENGEIIADAKFLKNIKVPAAKQDNISTYVWLLQNTNAKIKFLIFGKDREVSERYLKRYEPLIKDVEFYFFDKMKMEPLGKHKEQKLMSLFKR